jgi:hypothetical protein
LWHKKACPSALGFRVKRTTDRKHDTTPKPKKDKRKEQYENGYEDVKDLFTQQDWIIRDRYDKR